MKIGISKIILSVVALVILLTYENLFAFYGVGYSSFPMPRDNKLVSAELTGVIAETGGMGVQARYTQKTSSRAIIDAGLSVSGGARNSKIFAGIDYEIVPDYLKQPRFSLKGSFESARVYSHWNNNLGISPTLSKGFNVKGNEVYPYIALPAGISLHTEDGTYKTVLNASLGVNGSLPFKGYRHLTGNLEGMVNLKDSYSGVFAGISFPMN